MGLTLGIYGLIIIAVLSVVLFQFLAAFIFKNKNEKGGEDKTHLARKIQHAITALIILTLNISLDRNTAIISTTIGTVLVLITEILRFKFERLNKMMVGSLGRLMREDEKTNKIVGSFYYLLGLLVTFVLFDKKVSNLAILILGFGDPVASFCGLTFPGSVRIFKDKSIAGFLGCFLACFTVSFAYLYFAYQIVNIEQALIISLIGAFADLLSSLMNIDDNFSIPVISATGIFLYYKYFYICAYN